MCIRDSNNIELPLSKSWVSRSRELVMHCNAYQTQLTLNGIKLPRISSVRDLGITYSNTFALSQYVNTQQIRAKLAIARTYRSISNAEARLVLYKSVVRPGLEYGTYLFSNLPLSDCRRLESIQRLFTKSIFGYSSNLSYYQRCCNLNLDPLWVRRLKINLVFLFKLLRSQNLSEQSISILNNNQHDLRSNSRLISFPIARSNLRSNFFLIRYSQIWNTLPCRITSSMHSHQFSLSLDRVFTPDTLRHLLSPYLSIEALYEHGPGHIWRQHIRYITKNFN